MYLYPKYNLCMNENYGYVPTNSELNVYFTMSNGEERDVANFEYNDVYLIDKIRFKKENKNIKIKCENFNAFLNLLNNLFIETSNDSKIIKKCIKNEIETYRLDTNAIKEINIFIGSNDPNRGLKERESIDVYFEKEILETSSWDEK